MSMTREQAVWHARLRVAQHGASLYAVNHREDAWSISAQAPIEPWTRFVFVPASPHDPARQQSVNRQKGRTR